MPRMMLAIAIVAAILVSAVSAADWPLSEDRGYAAYRKGPCDKCVPGVKPMLSKTQWVTSATLNQRRPQRPWLKIRVNDHKTDLGKAAMVTGPELMLPVMAAKDLGLTVTRNALNHRLITLTGGKAPVEIVIGSAWAKVGDETRAFLAAPRWYNGKVYMPFESIAVALDWDLSFDPMTAILSVNTR